MVLSKASGYIYYIAEGTSETNPMRLIENQTHFLCGKMRVSNKTGNTTHFYRMYDDIEQEYASWITDRVQFIEEMSPGYTDPNKATVRADTENTDLLGILDLVFSDYNSCALFFYEWSKKGAQGDCEIWLNMKPPQRATPCQLLAKFVCENITISYWDPAFCKNK